MTLNRIITSLIQLVMLGFTIPVLVLIVKDIKQNGFFPPEE